ncbi:MAG: DUF885 family protein [Elusimicrobia bacterium]|nr:DUF885 family protein [Elusimicrobiota bacterium]
MVNLSEAAMTLNDLEIPGTPEFVRVAKDIISVRFALWPNAAAESGLFDDAGLVPSLSPANIAYLIKRLKNDLKALRQMPWKAWDVDRQMDFRWIVANAEEALQRLEIERSFIHRPSDWLEPTANNLIALLSYAPERQDLIKKIIKQIPAMVQEMRHVCLRPTKRDAMIAQGIINGLLDMLQVKLPNRVAVAAARAIQNYSEELSKIATSADYETIGKSNYAWRCQKALLLPWTPDRLLALAEAELKKVDDEMAQLKPRLPKPVQPTPEQKKLAASLTREKLLGLYTSIVEQNRTDLLRTGAITIPQGVGPIFARETPKAMIPLTGDGGSMNPPPPLGSSGTGYWNVETFHEDWTQERRQEAVMNAQNYKTTGMGPYAVHEGIPGHFLQLSIARLNPNPLRSILSDSVQNEGWALYAEEAFWESGGLGDSVQARYNILGSWRYRIRRVIYDVHVETGRWTLQQAADFKHNAAPGQGKIDEDLQRTINWPTQLIGYFAGKMQILQLKEDYKKKMGSSYSERDFHDALLAVGSIPYSLGRAKLLGETIPEI